MKNGDDLLTRHLNANSTARHQELIAPVRELVKDIHKSELYSRSLKADAYHSQPYFTTDVEMTARAFEGHIQYTLSKMGIKNDFLVNIKAEKDWQKNLDAYPYPKAEELEPLGKAYNAVFDTLKEVDKEFIPTYYEPEQIIHADTLAVTEAEKTKENQPFALDTQNQDNTYSNSIDNAIQGKPLDSAKIWVGRTPQVLQMLGVQDLPVYIHRKTVLKDAIRKHNITADDLKAIPSQLERPIAVMKSAQTSSNPNAYLVLTELIEKENGKDKPVIAILSVAQKEDSIEINSVYGRNQSQIERDLNNVLYWDSKKGQQFIDSFGYQLPPSLSNADLSHHYKTEQDLSQYILQSLDKERIEQFLQIAAEIQAKIDNAPNKELSVFAQVIYEDTQSVHDKAQKEIAPTFDELEIAKRHLEGLNYSFEKNSTYYQFGGLINYAKMSIYHEIDRQDWQKVDDVQVSYDSIQDENTHLYSIKINGKTYELSSQDIKQRNFDAIKADLGYVVHKQHAVEIPPDDKGGKLGTSKSDEYLQKITDQILEPEQIIHADTLAVVGNDKIKEIRTEWGDFPPVISNGKLKELSVEDEYQQAKNGNFEQSAILIDKLLKDDTIQEIKAMIGNEKPIIVPILSEEATGKNRIPQAFAYALADQLDLEVDTNIRQINKAKRTDSGIYHRYVAQPEFGGKVTANQSYLIVDDTLSVGRTIANLKGYIENNGGKVIGATVMTAYEQKTTIAIKENMLQSISQKDGLNDFWIKEFGFGLDKLTQQEAGHLKKPTLEQIQNNVKEAQNQLISQKELSNEQSSQTHQTQQSEVHPTPKIDTAGAGEFGRSQQTGGAVLQSVLPSQETKQSTAKISTQNTYINCPYTEKDQAKSLGAKWDNTNKSWYVPAGLDLSKFEKWLTSEQEKSTKTPTNQQNKIYLYTTPEDIQQLQELKTQGVVAFDITHKVWYAKEADNPAVKQWLNRPNIPTPQESFADYLKANGIAVVGEHPILDGRAHRISNKDSADKKHALLSVFL